MRLYLDDERQPQDSFSFWGKSAYLENDEWTIVRNYNQFLNFITNNELPDLISFDHDLADEHYQYAIESYIPYSKLTERTGYHCLLWLLFYCDSEKLDLPEIWIHTMNREGENNMQNLLDAYKAI